MADVIVIGAGLNGLVASAALGRAGRKVLLLERGPATGGEARAIEFAEGFRAAPLTLDPGWLPPVVTSALGLSGRGELVASQTAVAVPNGDGALLAIPTDPHRAVDVLRAHSAADADRWPRFTARLHAVAGFLEALYQREAPDIDAGSLRELLPLLDLGRRFRGLGRQGITDALRILPMSVQELLDDWFEHEPLKAAVAAGGVQDIRQGPRSGGTAFVLLHHLVGAANGAIRGRPAWRAGPNALANTIEDAARAAQVQIRTGTDVEQIVVRDDAVAGVVLAGGEELAAKAVLSTLDPARTLLGLIDPVWLDPEFLGAVRNIKFRGSRATAQFALDGLPDTTGMDGVVSLTSTTTDLERAADAAKYGDTSERMHIEFAIPTLRWPDLAPEGKHVLVAHAQWIAGPVDDVERERLLEQITRRIGEILPGFTGRVLHQQLMTPSDLAERYGVTGGAVTHGELTLDQILFMRPVPGWGRYTMPISGLYLGGPGAHPGPGVLGGPGWLAARALIGR